MKKIIIIVAVLVVAVVGLGLVLTGCSKVNDLAFSNEKIIELENTEKIEVTYNSGHIRLYQNSENTHIVVKEYMSKDSQDYHFTATQDGNKLVIKNGSTPVSATFDSRLDIYLPINVANLSKIKLVTTSGSIVVDSVTALNNIDVNSTSGQIEVKNITVNTLDITATSSSVTGDHLNAVIDVTNTSGTTKLTSITGGGEFNSTSSRLELNFTNITTDVYAKSESGRVDVKFPKSTTGSFSAYSVSGGVDVKISGDITESDNQVTAVLGGDSSKTIKLESKSGKVEVRNN